MSESGQLGQIGHSWTALKKSILLILFFFLGERPYKCGLCDNKGFSRLQTLHEHTKKQHNAAASAILEAGPAATSSVSAVATIPFTCALCLKG